MQRLVTWRISKLSRGYLLETRELIAGQKVENTIRMEACLDSMDLIELLGTALDTEDKQGALNVVAFPSKE